MARELNKERPNHLGSVIDEILTGPANKGWRALILANRLTSPMRAADPVGNEDSINKHLAIPGSFSQAQKDNQWTINKVESASNQPINGKSGLSNITDINQKAKEIIKNKAIDYTKDKERTFNPTGLNDIIIVNSTTSPATYLTIQNRPNELSIDPVSSWASVKSFGRNDPFQIYGGSETTVSFEISWYSVDVKYRDDVITKCKLLESWSKSNGYEYSPPILNIVWGSSGLFDNDNFVLISAPYKLTHFQNHSIERDTRGQKIIKDLKLLPNYATQTLTFKKVTNENTTYRQMINQDTIKRTRGIFVNYEE